MIYIDAMLNSNIQSDIIIIKRCKLYSFKENNSGIFLSP